MPKVSIRFRKKTYSSISELARAHEMQPGTLIARLGRGMKLSEAIKVDLPRQDHKPIKIGRRKFASHQAAADHFGIGLTTLKDRITRQGMTPEEAVQTKKRNVPKSISLEGIRYGTIKEACIKYGVSQVKIANRLSSDWSIEEAFGLADRPDTEVAGVVYLVENSKNRKRYVGHTRTTVDKRWARHVLKAQSGDFSTGSLQEAIAHFGPDLFSRRVLEKSDGSLNHLLKLERSYIRKLKTRSPHGYNKSEGGEYAQVEKNKYKLEGRTFSTIEEVAEFYGLSREALATRLQRGTSLEDAVREPARYRNYVIEGTKFSGLKEACLHYQKNLSRVKARLERGWALDQAFDFAERERKGGPVCVTVNGIEYPSVSAAARSHGLGVDLVKSRIYKGWSIDQALQLTDPPTNHHGPKIVSIGGESFLTLADAARHHGLDPLLVRCRINKHKWTLEEALGLKSRVKLSKGRKVRLGRKTYSSIAAAARAHEQDPKNVRARLSNGWSLREALEGSRR